MCVCVQCPAVVSVASRPPRCQYVVCLCPVSSSGQCQFKTTSVSVHCVYVSSVQQWSVLVQDHLGVSTLCVQCPVSSSGQCRFKTTSVSVRCVSVSSVQQWSVSVQDHLDVSTLCVQCPVSISGQCWFKTTSVLVRCVSVSSVQQWSMSVQDHLGVSTLCVCVQCPAVVSVGSRPPRCQYIVCPLSSSGQCRLKTTSVLVRYVYVSSV